MQRLEAAWIRAGLAATFGLVLALAAPALAQTAAPSNLRGTSGGAGDLVGAPALSDAAAVPGPVTGSPAGSQLGVSPFTLPANYGKIKKRLKLPLVRKPGTNAVRPLPPLETYPTAPRPLGQSRRARGLKVIQPNPGPTIATIPALPRPVRPVADANPFAPVGFGVGSLRLFPYVDTSVGYASNPNQVATAVRGAGLARVEGGLGIQSDWTRHELKGTLQAGYSDFFRTANASRADAAATLDERIDVSRQTTVNLQQRYTYATSSPGSTVLPVLGPGVTTLGRPVVQTYGATAGITEKINRLSLNLRGAVDRTAYNDANLSDGTLSKLSADSFNDLTLRGRATYEVTAGISPFVEVTGSLRRHDQKLDNSANHYARDSRGLTTAVGTTLEFSRLLTGEASVGYGTRHYQDSRLADLRGLITDATLIWTPTPLTTVRLKAGTDLAETNTSGASGAVTRRLGVEVSHALWRNLTLGATLNYVTTRYQGVAQTDQTLTGGLKAEYNLTRSIVLRSSFTHERLKSSAPGTDYTANTFLLGLRLQH